jgi:hypothetical protein
MSFFTEISSFRVRRVVIGFDHVNRWPTYQSTATQDLDQAHERPALRNEQRTTIRAGVRLSG